MSVVRLVLQFEMLIEDIVKPYNKLKLSKSRTFSLFQTSVVVLVVYCAYYNNYVCKIVCTGQPGSVVWWRTEDDFQMCIVGTEVLF